MSEARKPERNKRQGRQYRHFHHPEKPIGLHKGRGLPVHMLLRKGRIAVSNLPLITDTEFKLMQEPSGEYTWAWGNVRKENRRTILELKRPGHDQKTIGETLGLSKGYVSNAWRRQPRTGYWAEMGPITQKGYAMLYGPKMRLKIRKLGRKLGISENRKL